jgi:alpha-2-macroglobulin
VRGRRRLKQLWQLGDDEARTPVDGRLDVITLPASESPLALWSRVEKECPKSPAVGEAIYQRGLYFQNRRQFSQAIAEYRRLIARYPTAPRASSAAKQVAVIEHADILLGMTGVYPQGSKPKIWFATRNSQQANFTIRRFDLKGYLAQYAKASEPRWRYIDLGANLFPTDVFQFESADQKNAELAKFLGPVSASWTEAVPRTDHPEVHTTQVPVTEAGVFVIEARIPGGLDPSRGLVMVTDAALIQQALPGKVLFWVVNPVTGKPLPGRKIEVHSSDGHKQPQRVSVLKTDEQGTVEWTPPKLDHNSESRESSVVLETAGGGILGTRMVSVGSARGSRKHCHFGITDRPIYRRGATVQFKIWLRDLVDNKFQPAQAGVKHRVDLEGPPDWKSIWSQELTTDASGSLTGSVKIDSEAALGGYVLSVAGLGWSRTRCEFQVEDYKKPEFEVTVVPSQRVARHGDVIRARIQAKYYFGKPVAGAAVRYMVFRKGYRARFHVAREWDWLYGNGYGDYEYPYSWLTDRDMQSQDDSQDQNAEDPDDYDAYDRDGRSARIADANTQLGPDGSVEIRIDTASDPGDRDYEYEINATVRDQSRRTVYGTERVVVSRRQLNVFAELDRGWYAPGSQAAVDLTTRSTSDVPLSTAGTLTLYRVKPTDAVARGTQASVSEGSVNAKTQEEVAGTWQVHTGPDGHLQFRFPVSSEGQYRLAFEARDREQQAARTSVTFWVYGPKFDGRRHRFGNLEMIPDRRSYAVGETARLLINTSQPDARLLVRDSLGQHWFLDIPAHSRVIEVPILDKHVPNYLVEATLVAKGAVHTEKCELYVPPVCDVVKVAIEADRPSYKPGETGHVRIRITDWWGKPVGGPLALTGFDKSLTYISGAEAEGPRSLLSMRLNHLFSAEEPTMLGSRLFRVSGRFVCPEFHLEDASKPQMGFMAGSMGTERDPSGAGVAEGYFHKEKEVDRAARAKQESRPLIEPSVRSNFSDTAVWLPNLVLDAQGTATAEITYPDSLTTWRIKGYVITADTRVGDGALETTTFKQLLVRLQAPRFAVEGDAVTLSANVHSDLPAATEVTAELIVPAEQFQPATKRPNGITPSAAPDSHGNWHFVSKASIGSHEQRRFDWPVTARSAGLAAITVQIRSNAGDDGVRIEMPVVARGSLETRSLAGSAAAEDPAEQSLPFELPPRVDASKTQIELSLSPSSCGVVLDALPFLAGYPYGCVEQTMSRFYPTVLAADTLSKLGIDLKSLGKNQYPNERLRSHRFSRWGVFDPAELKRMEQAGLTRLYSFQHDDGGWGWWEHDQSTPYMTAYVLLGLATAADAGVDIKDEAYNKALEYLYTSLRAGLPAKHAAEDLHNMAFVAYVLSLGRSQLTEKKTPTAFFFEQDGRSLRTLYDTLTENRSRLSNYGRTLLALALNNRGEHERARTALNEVLNLIQVDPKSGTATAASEDRREWWHWYNSDIETNAWVLRAIVAIDPKHPLAPKIANWLAAHRRHGEYWDSTRDTALAVQALSDYLRATYKTMAESMVSVSLDARHVADVTVDWNRMVAGACRVEIDGKELTPGAHKITLIRKERQPLYYSMLVRYFDRAARVAEQASGIRVSRRYYKLPPELATPNRSSDNGPRARTSGRSLLNDGDAIAIGDTVEVELTIASDETYEFIAFEDPKPAGLEPTNLQSGYERGSGLCSNVELRDQEVVFFAEVIRPGTHVLKYKLRAEVPGTFQARPTHAFDMYHPQINAHSNALRLQIHD